MLLIRIFETLTEECCKYFNVVKMQHKSACFLLTPKSKKDTRKINLYKMYRVCNKVKKDVRMINFMFLITNSN